MYNSLPVLALRFAARNRRLSPAGGHATPVQRLQEEDLATAAENLLVRDGGYMFSRATGEVMYHEMPIEAMQEVARNQQLSHIAGKSQHELSSTNA